MNMEKNIIYTLSMSLEDVEKAVRVYAKSLGMDIEGQMTIDAVYTLEEIKTSNFYCDYIDRFNGLKLVVKE